MERRVKHNVQSFPRPPLVEKTSRYLQIKWNDKLIADTKEGYWVLETHHPPSKTFCHDSLTDFVILLSIRRNEVNRNIPAYYFPPSSIHVPLSRTTKSSYCEWKGQATYYLISDEQSSVSNRIWSYDDPTDEFKAIQGYLSFYAGPWECFVDGEKVEPQPGHFYGGWMTSDIEGITKGRMGNLDPV